MAVKKVWSVQYSATGSTKKITDTLGAVLAERLGIPFKSVSLNTPKDRETQYTFSQEDVVVVGTPTYAGKMPNKLLPAFHTNLVGGGALAVAVVTFGNRSYDNALAELCAVLEKDKFHTIGGVACVAQHAFAEKLAAGRPDAQDLALVTAFAERLAEQLRSLTGIPAPVQVPGDADAPYYVPRDENGQPANFLRARPKTDLEKCVSCGVCAELCPMGSINRENTAEVLGICIKCQACIKGCRQGAKYFDDPVYLSHKAMLEEHYPAPKRSEVFLAEF